MYKKLLSSCTILFACGAVYANPKAVPSVPIDGLPLIVAHATEPGTATTQSVDMAQLTKESLLWNVTCNYIATETGSGTFPISLRVSTKYMAYVIDNNDNHKQKIFMDGNFIAYNYYNHPVPVNIDKQAGTFTFTLVYAYQDPFDDGHPTLTFSNLDSTGDITITSCIADNTVLS